MGSVAELLEALSAYREARLRLLRLIEVPVSNRDPLSEFTERFVAALTGGSFPANRNQPGWDVRLPDGSTVQVKFLANAATGVWVNWHPVRRIAGADWYAVVLIEDFRLSGVLMFPTDGLEGIGAALGKRGKLSLADGWDLTRTTWLRVRNEPDNFRKLGMRVFLPPDWAG